MSLDRGVDRLATDVGFFEAGYVHAAQLAGNLLGRQTLAQHMATNSKRLMPGSSLRLGRQRRRRTWMRC